MRISLLPALLIGGLLACFSCRPVSPDQPDPGYLFFPLETGRYTIYNVTDSVYTLTSPKVWRTYQIKEVTGPVYTDVTGQKAYQLQRYRRLNEQQPWQPDSVWTARLVNGEAIRNENGKDYVKLVFPIGNRVRWDGNKWNAMGEDTYEMRNTSRPFRVLDKLFDETVTVVQQNDSTLVSQDKRIEVYAKEVGLIYREKAILQLCQSGPCVGKAEINSGIRQTYRILTYGKE
ncbi:hypothetical protein [Nibrella saemangeumensis]